MASFNSLISLSKSSSLVNDWYFVNAETSFCRCPIHPFLSSLLPDEILITLLCFASYSRILDSAASFNIFEKFLELLSKSSTSSDNSFKAFLNSSPEILWTDWAYWPSLELVSSSSSSLDDLSPNSDGLILSPSLSLLSLIRPANSSANDFSVFSCCLEISFSCFSLNSLFNSLTSSVCCLTSATFSAAAAFSWSAFFCAANFSSSVLAFLASSAARSAFFIFSSASLIAASRASLFLLNSSTSFWCCSFNFSFSSKAALSAAAFSWICLFRSSAFSS